MPCSIPYIRAIIFSLSFSVGMYFTLLLYNVDNYRFHKSSLAPQSQVKRQPPLRSPSLPHCRREWLSGVDGRRALVLRAGLGLWLWLWLWQVVMTVRYMELADLQVPSQCISPSQWRRGREKKKRTVHIGEGKWQILPVKERTQQLVGTQLVLTLSASPRLRCWRSRGLVQFWSYFIMQYAAHCFTNSSCTMVLARVRLMV